MIDVDQLLLISDRLAEPDSDLHVGTQDLDLGLQVTILENSEYQEFSHRLRTAGFSVDKNSAGRPTRQRWIHPIESVTIDFLIPPNKISANAGSIQNLEDDFAALITPGLELAFIDCEKRTLSGLTLHDEIAEREVFVCGPAAFVILKALALRNRGENKDAYDLHYVLNSWPEGLDDIIARARPLIDDEIAQRAIGYLKADFDSIDSVGAKRLDRFVGGFDADDEQLRADASALVTEFVRRLKK